MRTGSIWEQNNTGRPFPEYEGEMHREVLIVGGGMAGILCAWQLKQAGVDCLLLEQGRIGGGTTKNTTAKVTAQHGLCYDELMRRFGAERARRYYESNQRAVEAYRSLADRFPCGWEEKTAYIYGTGSPDTLWQEANAYDRLGIASCWRENPPLPMKTCGALGLEKQGQLHPLKLLKQLAEGLEIYENSFVEAIEGNRAITKRGSVTAEHMILATHFPMVNIPGAYFLKLYQRRSYVAAIQDGPQVDGMYLEDRTDGYSFRNYENYLFLGGCGHKTGGKGGGFSELESMASYACPGKPIVFRWAAQDCMSLDGLPYIGRHRKKTPHLYVATGFHKWGMTGSMAAAMTLTDLVTKGESPWEQLYSPERSLWHGQLFVNLGNAALNLVTPGKRCPHMGCALKWNPGEKTWDCPCHGSRFDERGRILNNPAKHELKHAEKKKE